MIRPCSVRSVFILLAILVPLLAPAAARATDTIAPVVNVTSPTEGQHIAQGATVVVAFTCVDETDPAPLCFSGVANGSNLDTSTPGAHYFLITSSDSSGNMTQHTANYVIDGPAPAPTPDTELPVITIGSPIEGQSVPYRGSLAASYACFDAISAITSCAGPVPVGSNIDTALIGWRTFSVGARDSAGNTATRTVTYQVQPQFGSAFVNAQQVNQFIRDLLDTAVLFRAAWNPFAGLQAYGPAAGITFTPSQLTPTFRAAVLAMFSNVRATATGQLTILFDPTVSRSRAASASKAATSTSIRLPAQKLTLQPDRIGAFRLKLTRAQLAALKRAKSAKLVAVVTVTSGKKTARTTVTIPLTVKR